MALYRLYFMDERGRFRRREEFEVEGDDEAIRRARKLRDRGAAELWCGKRKVLTFEAAAAGGPA